VNTGGLEDRHSGAEPAGAGAGTRAEGLAWRNELGGVVEGSVVQAQTIHGGVHVAASTPSSAELPPPMQLPPMSANFAGRSAELAMLEALVSDYNPARRLVVVVIIGAGGMGKTSLASYWLNKVRGQYEHGALFADLGGHLLAEAARPENVLAGFLRSLGVAPERVPPVVGEQAALFRSVTSGQRLIVFLDNAASAAQVRVLLPGTGPTGGPPSLVVVTTRWRISGLAMDGARFIELGPLGETAALDLFDRMIGTERATTEANECLAVVRLCGGIPLAVCITGARLAAHPRWPVGRVARDLASERSRLTALSLTDDLSVRAAFDASYRVLPPDAAHAYCMTALIPGPDFVTSLASAALDIDEDRIRDSLEILADASLLTEVRHGQYRFHDLARLHAREHAASEPSTKRAGAIERSVDWYLRHAVAADLVVSPGRWHLNPMYEEAKRSPPAFACTAAALEWLEAELPGLLAAVQAAHDQGLHDPAWQLCEALWGIFLFRKHFTEWISSHEIGLTSARDSANTRAEAKMRVQLGVALRALGRHEDARRNFDAALALARDDDHKIGEATGLEQLALIDLSQGKHESAIEGFRQARSIHQLIGATRGVAITTRHIGEVFRDAGRYPAAVDNLVEARRLFADLNDSYMEARATTSLAQTYLLAGRPRDAIPLLREALATMADLGSFYEQARILRALGDAASQLGDLSAAQEHLGQALATFDGISAPEAADVRNQLAVLDRGGGSGNPASHE
jgi:tetratricopeptide (TPR) repeat protein